MIGTSGTSHTGKTHAYYTCLKRNKQHACNKKNENKQALEDFIITTIKEKVLQPINLEKIANKIVQEYNNNLNNLQITNLEYKIKEIDGQLDNITKQFIEAKNKSIIERLNKQANDLTELQENYQQQINKLRLATSIKHTKEDIINYLKIFVYQNLETEKSKQKLINTFINSIYVYDDYISIYLNIIDNHPPILFEETKKDLEHAKKEFAQSKDCSTKKPSFEGFFHAEGLSNFIAHMAF